MVTIEEFQLSRCQNYTVTDGLVPMCLQWEALVYGNSVDYGWGTYYALVLLLFYLVFKSWAAIRLTARASRAAHCGEQ